MAVLRPRRILAAAATAALVLGGVITTGGTASAATTMHCANAVAGSLLAPPDALFISGCDTFTDTGGPYTLRADVSAIPCSGGSCIFGVGRYNYLSNIVWTCQSLSAASDPYTVRADGCTR